MEELEVLKNIDVLKILSLEKETQMHGNIKESLRKAKSPNQSKHEKRKQIKLFLKRKKNEKKNEKILRKITSPRELKERKRAKQTILIKVQEMLMTNKKIKKKRVLQI